MSLSLYNEYSKYHILKFMNLEPAYQLFIYENSKIYLTNISLELRGTDKWWHSVVLPLHAPPSITDTVTVKLNCVTQLLVLFVVIRFMLQ